MGRYEDYKLKMERLAKVRNFLRRNILIIVTASAVATASVVSLVSTKGMITSEPEFKASYVYGEGFVGKAGGFMANAIVEYAHLKQEDWSIVEPTNVGQYKARARAANSFGGYNYGEVITFEITPKDLTFSCPDASPTYGDKPILSAEGLVNGDMLSSYNYSYGEEISADMETTATFSDFVILNAKQEDVTRNYSFSVPTFDLKLKKRKVSVLFDSISKVYDGKELSFNDKIRLTSGSLAYDHRFVYEGNSLTHVGESPVLSNLKIVDGKGKDVSRFYDLSATIGNLSINKKSASVSSPSGKKEYDGKPFADDDAELNVPTINGFIESDKPTVAFSPRTEVNVGDHNNEFTVSCPNAGDYDISESKGKLTISPRPVTINFIGEHKYEGSALGGTLTEGRDYTLSQPGLAEGDKLSITVDAKDYDSLFSTPKYACSITNSLGDDVSGNYHLTFSSGPVYKKADATFGAKNVSVVYDGKPHSGEWIMPSLQGDDQAHLSNSDSVPTATDVTPKISYEPKVFSINNGLGEDRTMYYNITTTSGSFEITKRPLKITTVAGATRAFKGSKLGGDLDSSEYIIDSSSPLPSGHTVKVSLEENSIFSASQSFIAKVYKGEVDVSSNFDIEVNGRIMIEKGAFKVEGRDTTLFYDGKPHGYAFVTSGLLGDNQVAYSNQTSMGEMHTDVGIYRVTPIVDSIKTGMLEDVTDYYTTSATEATLTIKQRPISVTTYSHVEGKTFDVAVNEDALEPGESLTTALAEGDHITETLYQETDDLNVTRVRHEIKVFNDLDNEVTSNYAINLVEPDESPIALDIKMADFEKQYDGHAHPEYSAVGSMGGSILPSETINWEKDELGNILAYDESGSKTLDFRYPEESTYYGHINSVTDSRGLPFENDMYYYRPYADQVKGGSYKITKRNLEIKIEGSRTYAGATLDYPLSPNEFRFTASSDGLAETDSISIRPKEADILTKPDADVSYSITIWNSESCAYVYSNDPNIKATNVSYDVNVTGYLSFNKAELDSSVVGREREYNSQDQAFHDGDGTGEGFVIDQSGLQGEDSSSVTYTKDKDKYDPESSGSTTYGSGEMDSNAAVEVGSYVYDYKVKITNSDGKDVTKYYDIKNYDPNSEHNEINMRIKGKELTIPLSDCFDYFIGSGRDYFSRKGLVKDNLRQISDSTGTLYYVTLEPKEGGFIFPSPGVYSYGDDSTDIPLKATIYSNSGVNRVDMTAAFSVKFENANFDLASGFSYYMTTPSDSKAYDGTPLKSTQIINGSLHTYYVDHGGVTREFSEGYSYVSSGISTQTVVGVNEKNDMKVSFISSEGFDITAYATRDESKMVYGKLTVTKAAITFTTSNISSIVGNTVTFDATQGKGWDFIVGGTSPFISKIYVTPPSSRTFTSADMAGETKKEFINDGWTFLIRDSEGNDVTDSYFTINYVWGTITVLDLN